MDLFPKFIIEDGNLIIAKCTYHRQLATDETKVKGGGWFSYNDQTKTFTLFGASDQFGAAKIEDIKQCIADGNVYSDQYCANSIADGYNFVYNTQTEIIPLK